MVVGRFAAGQNAAATLNVSKLAARRQPAAARSLRDCNINENYTINDLNNSDKSRKP